MYYSKASYEIKKKLKRIEKNVNNKKNGSENIKELESLLNQPYLKSEIKNLLFKSYLLDKRIKQALDTIKKLYEENNEEKYLFELVKLLLDIGDTSTAKKYIDQAYYSEMKIYLEGLYNEYIGENDRAINCLNKLNHTVMEEDMHIELSCVYENMHDIEKTKQELYMLLNTNKKYQALVRLIRIAIGENDNSIKKIFDMCDIDSCKHKGDLIQYRRCLTYYKYSTGELKEDDVENYSDSQLYDYSKERALYHIKKKHFDSAVYYKFNDDIDLNSVFEYCKKNLNHVVRKGDSDIYIVRMPYNVGSLMEYTTDLVEVITIHDTDKIVTLYPVPRLGKYYVNNLNKGDKRNEK